MIRSLLIVLGLLILPVFAFADSKVSISGSSMKVLEFSPESNTGLNTIFVVYDASGCTLSFKSSNGYTVSAFRYSNLGGGYAEEIRDLDREADKVSLTLSNDDMGFIFQEGDYRYYYWVVNYANHVMTLSSVSGADDRDCDYSLLDFDGNAAPITFYTINGQPRTLSREIYVDYTTQEFDEESAEFITVDQRKVLESILGNSISVAPPAYCPTYFTVSGDRFLRDWNLELSVESPLVQPSAVNCSTEAVQDFPGDDDEPSNIMKGDDAGLGGSAPADISFYAYVTDGVIHYEWQMSRSQDFENPDFRFYQKDLDYTFNEEGTFYLRFIGSNDDGSCETLGNVYTVSIGASALEIPNAFSPNDDGVNDVWKVSYRSLTEFHCEIFNRNGQKIYGFDEPSGGWDGTWHGKKVKPGVYYYVITATGADGQKYKKSGDINIINSIRYGTSTPSSPD